MQTENIVKFLQAYPDDRLAALRAHTEDEKLSYFSCSCLAGGLTADHALMGPYEYCAAVPEHLLAARWLPFAAEAEAEFMELGRTESGHGSDRQRREIILPLIIAEQERRDKLAQPSAEMHEAVEVE